MGANICKNPQNSTTQNQISYIQNKKVCFGCCQANNSHDQKISPIQFSDMSQFNNSPMKELKEQKDKQKQLQNKLPVAVIQQQQSLHSSEDRGRGRDRGSTVGIGKFGGVGKQGELGLGNVEQLQNGNDERYKNGTTTSRTKIGPNFTSDGFSHMSIALQKQKQKYSSIFQLHNIQLSMTRPIKVPNSIIKLSIKPQISKQGHKIQRNWQQLMFPSDKHTQKTPQSSIKQQSPPDAKDWYLHPKGFYFRFTEKGNVVILTDQEFFINYAEEWGNGENRFRIQGDGVLINCEGSYRGGFREGMAHGKKGIYISANGKRKYEGQWQNGQLIKGQIQTQVYAYDGSLKNNMPHGKGTLNVYKKNIFYQGDFVQGKFDTPNGQYQCQQYSYKGGFKDGKKNGMGVLTVKQKSATKQNPNIKFKPEKIFKGVFRDDVIYVEKTVQKKK